LIVIREIDARAVRRLMTEVPASVRVHMAMNNRVRVINVSQVRVEHWRKASRHERWHDETGEEATARQLHVKVGLWWQCEETVKPSAIRT
jgi:hypothetical protein